jgi:membrane dipeptidase
MIIVDAHCDTITRLMETKENLIKNNCHVDIERMKQKGSYVQFFAAFISPEYCQAYAMKRAMQIIDKFYQQIEIYSDNIMSCCNYRDIENAVSSSKVAAILSIEGGDALQGDLSALRMFYRLGVRSLCLTWNHRNEIADGVADGITGGGLTPFGRDVIMEMNRLGMIVDVSHLSERGFWDVVEISGQPIIASHSNAKSVCSHRRNLTDEQILALKNNGGVMGMNLCPAFLTNEGEASLKDVINHIEHIASVGGIDIIGIGADFDGIDDTPREIKGVENIDGIFNELLKLNYPQKAVDKIAGGNFLRVIRQVLK